MKSFMKPLLLISTLMVTTNAMAECQIPKLTDFAAYAIETMDLRSSDHQGMTGAGRGIRAEKFLFEGNSKTCLSVSTLGDFDLSSGNAPMSVETQTAGLNRARVGGDLSARGQVELISSSVVGTLRSPVRPTLKNSSRGGYSTRTFFSTSHAQVSEQLFETSRKLSEMPVSGTIEKAASDLLIQGTGSTVVVNLDANSLRQVRKITLRGSGSQHFILNISGADVSLRVLNVVLEGGVHPSKVSWNFPQADRLFIANTVDAWIGLPGAFYAPYAVTEFYEGLITGGLFVKKIIFDPAQGFQHSGQLNRSEILLPGCICLCW